MRKKGQQEIAGFVIIVVLVVVASLIFLVLSFRDKDNKTNSLEVGSLLNSLLSQTTECVVSEPLPLNLGELVREAYGGIPTCRNLGVTTREYLNSTIYDSMGDVLRNDRRFEAWQIDIYSIEDNQNPLARFYSGSCGDKQVSGADRIVGEFRVELNVCLNSYD